MRVAAKIVCALAVALVLASTAAPAFASSPEVIASAPADGAQAVPCEGRMWVQFETNVAAVPENATLVVLETSEGAEVSPERYSVSLPDPELEFAYRQYIWIDVSGLDPGAGYVLCVKPGIASKNGVVNDVETRIAFSTAGPGAQPVALADPVAVKGGTGNGDGTGGGDGSGPADASASDGASASAEAPEGSGPEAQSGASRSDSGEEVEVVYVDEHGNPVSEEEPREPMPAGEIALFVLCAIVVVVGLGFAVRRSQAQRG